MAIPKRIVKETERLARDPGEPEAHVTWRRFMCDVRVTVFPRR